MKILFPFLLLSIMLIASCGGNQTTKSEADAEESVLNSEEAPEASELNDAMNCDEFIDQYEKWMDNYLVILEKYMKNPMDQTLAQEYINSAQEISNWSTQWVNSFSLCATNKKYATRFKEITEKANKKLEELGLN